VCGCYECAWPGSGQASYVHKYFLPCMSQALQATLSSFFTFLCTYQIVSTASILGHPFLHFNKLSIWIHSTGTSLDVNKRKTKAKQDIARKTTIYRQISSCVYIYELCPDNIY